MLFRCYGWLFPAIILATAFQNYDDLSVLMTEGTLMLYRYDGSAFFKITKDAIYAVLFLAILFHSYRIGRLPLTRYSAWLIALIFSMVVFSIVNNDSLAGLIGLRWVFPFFLFVLMKDWSRLVDLGAAVRWMLFGLGSCLAVQSYQLFFMPPVFGEVLPGISARTPGFFVAPNSAAFFACASAACIMVFEPFRLKLRMYSVVLAMAVSALAQSGTGMVASSLLVLLLICGRQQTVFWLVALFGVALALPNLDVLTGRERYVELSGGGRIDSLLTIIDESALSFASFGLYTNAANLLSDDPAGQLAPDSLIASWAGNFGIFSPLAFLLSALFVRYGMRVVDWRRAMPCVLVFGAFSMTTIVFEAFPMNLYLALGVWSAQRFSNSAVA